MKNHELDPEVVKHVRSFIIAIKLMEKEMEKALNEIQDPLARDIFYNACCFGLSAGIVSAVMELQKGAKKKNE